VVTSGYKVIATIGSNIAQRPPRMAFAVQMASAVNVHLYTLLGVPVSTSHSTPTGVLLVGSAPL
jgi:inorganic phosphate transporter, PiT family